MHLRTQLLAAIIMTSCGILLGAGTNSLYPPNPAVSVEEAGEMQVLSAELAAVSNAEAEAFTEKAAISAGTADSVRGEREYKDTGEQGTGKGKKESVNEDTNNHMEETEVESDTGNMISVTNEGDEGMAGMDAGSEAEGTGSAQEESGISVTEAETADFPSDGTPSNAVLADAGPEAANSNEAQPYTEEDLYILAHVICGEAQCYPDDEQRYVGSVVLNRVANSRYPGTIKDVVFQKGQYACTRDGNYYREPTEANWANAKWLLENGSVLPVNVVYQSRGKQGSGVYLQTKYHKYCY